MHFNPNSVGFINNAKLAFVYDVTLLDNLRGYNHRPNLLEAFGQVAIWHITDFPRLVYQSISDPRVLTVVLTIFAHIAVQFAFYPAISMDTARMIIQLLIPEPWKIKLALYILTQITVFGYGSRALGRFTNADLMQAWRA